MARESLGLFDRPPSRNEKRLACLIVGLAAVAFMLLLPSVNEPLPEIDAFIPALNSIMFVGELIIGALLYGQAAVFRSRALVLLASVYIFGTLMLIPHTLTFPGAVTPGGLLGAGLSTTAYLGACWRLAFPIGIIGYALLARGDLAKPAQPAEIKRWIRSGIISAITLAILATLAATVGHDSLPRLFVDRRHITSNLFVFTTASVTLSAVGLVLLATRFRSVLDMWLMTAIACGLIQAVLNLLLDARFTVGWYGLWLLLLLSNMVITLALLVESNWVYARLALSTAARRREREARLLSMQAVTAAISHEVGQPLSAVGLNASAAISWLSRKKPNVEKAIESLREASDAGRRSFEIIKSIRATFAKDPARSTDFNLNELVRETAYLLNNEIAVDKISLDLSLDDSIGTVFADQVQIQRVLVNLVMNAAESLRGSDVDQPSITVRTASGRDNHVAVEISDNGTGIADEDLDSIFDVFFTTKATGTGLGLALCRTIVEEHGGRLWASRHEPHGASFTMELPRSGSVAITLEEIGEVLENLEASVSWMRHSTAPDAADITADLQRVIDEVRSSVRKARS